MKKSALTFIALVKKSRMKIFIIAFLLITSPLFAQVTSFQSAPISCDDILRLLNIETRADKRVIAFAAPKYVTLRVLSGDYKQDHVFKEKTSKVTLLTYIPAQDGETTYFHFWITSDQEGTISSVFDIDRAKAKRTTSGLIDGVYTIISSDSEDMKNPAYRIQVITSDEKP